MDLLLNEWPRPFENKILSIIMLILFSDKTTRNDTFAVKLRPSSRLLGNPEFQRNSCSGRMESGNATIMRWLSLSIMFTMPVHVEPRTIAKPNALYVFAG